MHPKVELCGALSRRRETLPVRVCPSPAKLGRPHCLNASYALYKNKENHSYDLRFAYLRLAAAAAPPRLAARFGYP